MHYVLAPRTALPKHPKCLLTFASDHILHSLIHLLVRRHR